MWKFSLVVFLPHLFVYKVYTQQFSFNFENRELSGWHQSHQGHWHLDTIHPLCGSASLHHNYDNQEAGFDAISYNHDMLYLDKQDASWEFVIQHRYNPSSSNNWAVWLVADNGAGNMGPEGTNSGYIIGVNFIGSDDYLKLWRKEDNQINGVLSTDFNWQEGIDKDTPVWIKVERTVGGIWKIFYDLTGKKDWQYLDSKMDGMIKSGN